MATERVTKARVRLNVGDILPAEILPSLAQSGVKRTCTASFEFPILTVGFTLYGETEEEQEEDVSTVILGILDVIDENNQLDMETVVAEGYDTYTVSAISALDRFRRR